jgi:hypothetical protein
MLALTLSVFWAGFEAATTHAASIQIQPTIYKNVILKKGEKAKSFVDISNPTATTQEIRLTVQRYKQIDDSGSLTFFDDESVSKGVKLDLDNFELNPRDSIRVFFQLDGTILPFGDIFAAIFARTVPRDGMVAQAVQVGTLLAVTNGTPAAHTATIDNLSASPFQWSDSIDAALTVKNTAPEGSATGFFPQITVNLQPYSSRTVEGPLVFAGRSRSVSYTQKGSYFGIIRLNVQTDSGQASRWLFAVTGYWRWLAPTIIFGILLIVFTVRQRGRVSGYKRP